MYSFRRRFNINRSLRIFALTFAAAGTATGYFAYDSGDLHLTSLLWQSSSIAVLVAVGAGWMLGDAVERPPARPPGVPAPAESRPGGPARTISTYRVAESLEEQGITIKLLELIALGDRYGNTFSVALIGVDHLAEVRDRYDPGVTRYLLEQVSTTLAHTLRMPDRVGEYDHGTYLVVLPETKLPGAVQIAERLRGAISGMDIAVSRRIHLHTTASVGVTSFRRGDDLQSMLDRAGKALREAQNQGSNRVLPDMAA